MMWTRQSLLGSIVTLALICGSVLFAILDKSFRRQPSVMNKSYIPNADQKTNVNEYQAQVKSPLKGRDVKQHLLHACEEQKSKNLTSIRDVYNFNKTKWLIAERFKLLACRNFKVGSRNIARIMYTLDHLSEQIDPSKINKNEATQKAHLKNEDSLEIQYTNYTKFLFVREPLERLLSAYRDERPREFFKPGKRKVNFKTFLERVITVPHNETNPHHISFTRMCNPCGIKYDFIGLMDSYETDMKNILESVGADRYVSVPHRNQTGYMQNKSDEVLQAYLKELPKALIKRVYEKYYWDYFLFGFSKPNF